MSIPGLDGSTGSFGQPDDRGKGWFARLDLATLEQDWQTDEDLFNDDKRVDSPFGWFDVPIPRGNPVFHRGRVYQAIPWYDTSWASVFSKPEMHNGGRMVIYEIRTDGAVVNKLVVPESTSPDVPNEGSVHFARYPLLYPNTFSYRAENELIAAGDALFWLEGHWMRKLLLEPVS